MFFVPVTRNAYELSRSWDRLFDDSLFDRLVSPIKSLNNMEARSPALEVTEGEQDYTVKVDLPGMSKEDVKISVDGRRVTVEASSSKNEEKKEGDRILYTERSIASFSRSFTLPLEIDQAQSSAKMDNGVLTLSLAKRTAGEAKQLTIR
ncbi:MAG: Hsp20/alpha crystallin family protein [Burkholderiaceae bacterium]|nr:Hsp20/alpha crystallin family protein [Burkholderiaceae bacterium]